MEIRTLFAVLFIASSSLAADPAPPSTGAPAKPAKLAKPPKGAKAPPAPPLDAAAAEKLRSGDEAKVHAALDDLRVAGKNATNTAPVVAEVLQRGLSLPLTEAAIDTLGDIENETTTPAVAWYASHRVLTVRRAAVKALVRTKGAAAVDALRHSLSDQDPMIRGVAATGLGTLKAKEAVPDLFVALDHRVPEAAASIGSLCEPAQCDQLMSHLGRLPFDVVTSGLDQVLFRPTAEVTDDAKVKIIGRLRELGTQEANKFLREVQGRWPEGWSKRVRQSIDQAVLATAGGAK
jgi:HEAT repeat protein